MSVNRFLLLLRFQHFEDETTPEYRVQEISPLMDHLNSTMSNIYCPNENLLSCCEADRPLGNTYRTNDINME